METVKTSSNGKATPEKGTSKPTEKTTLPRAATKRSDGQQQEIDNLKGKLAKAQTAIKETGQEALTAKAEVLTLQKQLDAKKPLNVADAMVKITESKAVLDKLDFLRETRKQLSDFSLGREGSRDLLRLTDGSGKEFASSNTETIQLVLNALKSELDGKIQVTETEMLNML